jgi:hypothetical protein
MPFCEAQYGPIRLCHCEAHSTFQFSFILRIERSVSKIDEQELLKRLEEIEKWGNEGV